MHREVKVAVVGSGLAGLTAAYLLSQAVESNEDCCFEVHLFEKAPLLGMDSSSVTLPILTDNRGWRVDVPMRSFQGGYYPQLISLYRRIGVAFRQADFSYSFSTLSNTRRQMDTTMLYNGASGLGGVSMPSGLNEACFLSKDQGILDRITIKAYVFALFALSTLLLTLNYVRLIFLSLPFLRTQNLSRMTFREWSDYSVPKGFFAKFLGLDNAWRTFTSQTLSPLFSAVCTTSQEDVLNHPVSEFLDYIWLVLGTHHYVVTNGVRDVATRLTSHVRHIHLSSTISAVRADSADPSLATIHCTNADGTTIYSGFHHIVFATQATRAVPLLSSFLDSLPPDSPQRKPVEEQIGCLRTFQYHDTIVINHTDDTLMPNNTQDRRDLNLVSFDGEINSKYPADKLDADTSTGCVMPTTYTMATHVLPTPPDYPAHCPRVYQTTNPIIAPRKDSILSIAHLERAVLTLDAKRALSGLYTEGERRWWGCACQSASRLGPLQGAGRLIDPQGSGSRRVGIWICGSYAYAGIPLLEGCVVSAKNVAEQGILVSEGMRTANGIGNNVE